MTSEGQSVTPAFEVAIIKAVSVQAGGGGNEAGGLADLLDNGTNVQGRYKLVLEVAMNEIARGEVPNPATDLEPAVLRAFNDGLRKLGLRLERGKGQVETLIVERIERMPSPN